MKLIETILSKSTVIISENLTEIYVDNYVWEKLMNRPETIEYLENKYNSNIKIKTKVEESK